MKVLSKSLWSFLAAACFCACPLVGQELTDMTLDFNNITSTNVNQTQPETTTTSNEKEVEFGDWDNDGDTDVVIAVGHSDFDERLNKLYRNDNGVLNEVSGTTIIPGFGSVDVARSAYFRDYNDDNRMDIIVICDSNSGTNGNEAPGKTKLYLQNASGNFVNTSQNLSNQTGAACNGISEDFDGNGLYDLMMCNYPNISQDSMTLNGTGTESPGEFTIVTNTHYPSEGFYGVHAEGADMNGDGQIDMLVANWTGHASFIYYNNNNNAGSGMGDFRYAGAGASTSFAAIGGGDERAMFPVDINNDGLMDMYFANFGSPGRTDHLFINTGNDANNKATFTQQAMPSITNRETNKVECDDLDGDGKADLIFMSEPDRPIIFRNISAGSDISFIEWTPANMTAALDGWHANSADITGNDRPDILFGANSNDHLFENVAAAVTDFDSLSGGLVPTFHNDSPIAVSGTIAEGETKTFILIGGASGIPFGSTLSILARSAADIGLNVNVNGADVATSDRTGEGVLEGVQYETLTNNNLIVELTNNGGGVLFGDINGDGMVNLLDVQPFVDLLSTGGFDEAADGNGDGLVNLLDVQFFVDALSGGGPGGAAAFVVEFLSRTG